MTQAATTMPTPIVTEMAATPQFTEGRFTVLHLLAVHEGVVLESASIAEYGGVWFKDISLFLLLLNLAAQSLGGFRPSDILLHPATP
jgi:hypothetical protein